MSNKLQFTADELEVLRNTGSVIVELVCYHKQFIGMAGDADEGANAAAVEAHERIAVLEDWMNSQELEP